MIDHIEHEKNIYTTNYRGNKKAVNTAKKYIRRVKSMSRCIRCGECAPWCLDFHHRDPDDKLMSIPDMAKRGFPIEIIKIELNKCDCICSNHHREIHFKHFWLKL